MLSVISLSFPVEPSMTAETAPPPHDAVFRVGRFQRQAMGKESFHYLAVLHAFDQALTVSCPANSATGVQPGVLVRLTLSEWSRVDGDLPIEVAGLVVEKQPDATTNPFRTIPPEWAIDQHLLTRSVRLWEALSPGHRMLFNAVFWCTNRFRRYLTFPLDIRSKHSPRSSLLAHSIELAELATQDVNDGGSIDRSLIILGALLYVAGKIDAWIGPADDKSGAWVDTAQFLGHRLVAYSWIVLACERYAIPLSGAERVGIDHVLVSLDGKGGKSGFPVGRSIEAKLIQTAHAICQTCEIHGRP